MRVKLPLCADICSFGIFCLSYSMFSQSGYEWTQVCTVEISSLYDYGFTLREWEKRREDHV